jgi:hypothetical protein
MDGGAQDTQAMADSGEPMDPLTEFILKENKFVKDHTITEAWSVCSVEISADFRCIKNEMHIEQNTGNIGMGFKINLTSFSVPSDPVLHPKWTRHDTGDTPQSGIY